jgi:hypothetical protein
MIMPRAQYVDTPKSPLEFAALIWSSSPYAINDASLEKFGDVMGRVQQRLNDSAQRQTRLWSDFAERAAGVFGDFTSAAMPGPIAGGKNDDAFSRARASSDELVSILRAVADDLRDCTFANAQDVMEGLQAVALEPPAAAKTRPPAKAEAVAKASVSKVKASESAPSEG